MAGIRYKGQIFSGAAAFGTADHVAYDNTESGLSATDVQGALDEVVSTVENGGLRIAYVTIPINNAVIPSGSNFVVLNWGDVGGTYLPGKTIVGAFLAFSSGSVSVQGNCQVTDGHLVYLTLYNPSGNAVTISTVILAVFYYN